MGKPVCDNCGLPYYRVNKASGWTSQNPGRRTGWQKETKRICTNCQSAEQATRCLLLISSRVLPAKEVRKRRKRG